MAEEEVQGLGRPQLSSDMARHTMSMLQQMPPKSDSAASSASSTAYAPSSRWAAFEQDDEEVRQRARRAQMAQKLQLGLKKEPYDQP